MNRKPPIAVPDCPASLTGEPRREWQRVVRLLRSAGLISRLDRSTLACHCIAWARWLEAEGKLAEQGAVVESPSGYPIQNPWLSVSNAAAKQLKALAGELGLSPAARKRLLGKSKRAKKGNVNPFAPLKLKLESADAQC